MGEPKHEYKCEDCSEPAEYTLNEEKDIFEPRCQWCMGKMVRKFTPIPFAFKGKLNDG